MLSNRSGFRVQGPSKPLRVAWHLGTMCGKYNRPGDPGGEAGTEGEEEGREGEGEEETEEGKAEEGLETQRKKAAT